MFVCVCVGLMRGVVQSLCVCAGRWLISSFEMTCRDKSSITGGDILFRPAWAGLSFAPGWRLGRF